MKNPYSATNSTTSQLFLTNAHKRHIQERGLLNDVALANCRSVTAEEATAWLGFPVNCGGILFVGANLQVQLRPDIPYRVKPGEKPPKYLSPKGIAYDAYLPEHPIIKNYWDDIEALKKRCIKIDGKPCIVITEGVFKAIAGLTYDIPTISLLGVWMGLTSKKQDLEGLKYLVDSLRRFAEAGFGFIIAFDADAVTNPDVVKAEWELSQKLLQYVPNVYTVTGHWDAGVNGEVKGMDDFIHKQGIEEFREILERCVLIQKEEVEPANSTSSASKVPTERGCLNRRATAELYSDPSYVSDGKKLYRRVGNNNLEPCNEAVEKRRIADWLESYSDKYERGMYVKCTRPRIIKEILEWVIIRKAFNPSEGTKTQEKDCHLRDFACDANLEKRLREGKVDLKELYTELSIWYKSNKLKPVIKKSSCLFEALKPLFPELKKGKFKRGEGRLNGTYFTLVDISSDSESESENDSDSGSEERSEEQNAEIILTSLQVDVDSAETIDVVGVSACKHDDKDDLDKDSSLQSESVAVRASQTVKMNDKDGDRDGDLPKSSLQGSSASTASYPVIQDPWEDSKDDFVSSQCATEIATDIRTAIKEKNNSRLARAINLYFTQCVAEKEVTREAVYALLDANEVAEWELLLNPQQSVPESIPSPSVESIPKSTPKPVKTKSLSVGDRVIVSNPKLENYKGVKGRINAEWFTTKGKEYTVRFDEPIGTEDWADFTSSELSVLSERGI